MDGTLAKYTSWQGISHIGEPIIPMVNHVKKWLSNGTRVKIMTARVSSKVPAIEREVARKAIEKWCLEHIGQALEVTAEKDFGMIELWDDRAITVEANTGNILTELERL